MGKIREEVRLLLDALRKFNDDHGFLLSAGITFNFLISLIPFALLLLALIGTYLYSLMWRQVYPAWANALGMEYGITARHYSEVLAEKIKAGEFLFPSNEKQKAVAVT
jgi:uncharacterized BrkB/YihY/UPF0761 family membrane protein